MAQSTDLRRVLLDISADLIRTEGLIALSMREVARRAGVSHQAPYHHFADREAILAALCEEGFAGLLAAFQSATDGVTGPLDRLHATGGAYLSWALAHPAHFRIMFRPELVTLARFPSAASVAEDAFGFLVRTVGELVAAGHVAPEQAEVAAMLVWSTVHGMATLTLDGPRPVKDASLGPQQAGEAVVALLTALLGRPTSTGAAKRRGPRS